MLTLTQENMEKRLSVTAENEKTILGKVMPMHRGGRKEGDTNIPQELRNLISVMASGPHGSVKRTAELFDISEAHAQNLKQCRVDGEHKDAKMAHEVEKLKGTVYERALEKTLSVLGHIATEEDTDEIRALPVIQKARLARDLSAVAKNMTPEHKEVNIGQVIVMNPGERSENDYPVVVVNRSQNG